MTANTPKTKSTGFTSSEAKVAGGLGVGAVVTLLLDFWSDSASLFSETERLVVLIGVFVLGAAYVISRGLKVTETRQP